MRTPSILALLGTLALAACVDRSPLAPDASPAPAAVERAFEVKFRDPLRVRLSAGRVHSDAADVQAAAALLEAPGVQVAPLFSATGAIERLQSALLEPGGAAGPDLGSWYRVVLPEGTDPAEFLARLRALPEVEHAYPAPTPAPPPGRFDFVTATTPDFSGMQGYFGAAPNGTGAAWARTLPGADGAGVTIVDLEYDWLLGHEDLTLPVSAQIGTSQRYTAFGSNHGTAVLGQLGARDNGFGVTGGVPAAELRVIPPMYGGWYIPANAILEAAAAIQPGDVILIEQQHWSPSSTYVALEVIPSVFDATLWATQAGRVVVAAAGNGGQDMDDPAMGGIFDRDVRDSGAIIVGAGSIAHARLYFSSYGSRVDVQGWGGSVATTGYGDLFGTSAANQYTSGFSGTSSASPIVAAAAAAVQGRRKAVGRPVLTSVEMRTLLRSTGTPQTGDLTQQIGPFPDLAAALASLGAPAAVASLSAAQRSGTSARVTWVSTGSNVTGFNLFRRARQADGSWGPWQVAATPGGDATRHDDSGLAPGGTYGYRINACNAQGCSAWATSAPVLIATTPSAPPELSVSPLSATTVRLAWLDATATESHFRIQRRVRDEAGVWSAFAEIAEASANATAFLDQGRLPGARYGYRIAACNVAGCSLWTTSGTIIMPAVPAAPSAVSAARHTATSIRVTWTDASTHETGFTVSRRVRGTDGVWGPFVDVAVTGPNATGYTDPGLAMGFVYGYRVRACDGPVCSLWTAAPAVTLVQVPAAPTALTASVASPTSVQLGWTDAADHRTTFTVARRLRNLDGSWQSWVEVASIPAAAPAYTATDLLSGRMYQFRVNACAGIVCSPWSGNPGAQLPGF